jgi:uncharacterized protein YegL
VERLGIDEEDEFITLKPLDGSSDESGAFKCNRRAGEHDTKIIEFPADFSCDRCTLQFQWIVDNLTYYSCADITVLNDNVKKCAGKCQNDGVCSNGFCVCVEPYQGEYCQYESKEEAERSYKWVWILLLLLLLGIAGTGYMYYKNKAVSSQNPVPFIEEKPQAIVQSATKRGEEPKMERRREQEMVSEERQGKKVGARPIGDMCYNGHPLHLSVSDEGCPGGYYLCKNCKEVFKCSTGRWVCEECPIDYCVNCKVPNEEEMRQLAARRSSNEISQDNPRDQRDSEYGATPEQKDIGDLYGRLGEPEELKGKEDFDKYIMTMVVSDQAQRVPEFREELPNGKVVWTKTHFIFLIDSSTSMKGSRWNSVKIGFEDCLYKLKTMEDIVVTGVTFDNKANTFCQEKSPAEAIIAAKNLPSTGEGTSYKRALYSALDAINRTNHPDYLICIVFMSDGLGGYPDLAVSELKDMLEEGKKLLFYTIGCETDDDADMMRMAENLNGEHYRVNSPEGIRLVFTKILAV